MLHYNRKNKNNSRYLRSHLTDAEILLWSHIRRKQINNLQFYRQKPIGKFIVDFYSPSVKLVIEIDGGQHFEVLHREQDRKRDLYLNQLGLRVLRFDNFQVLESVDSVLEVIFEETKFPRQKYPL